MTVNEFYNNLSELYPSSLSSSWDNDGLMCCADKSKEVRRVLVSLDASMAAIQYAAENGFDTLLTHHPMIFHGLKSVTENDAVSRRVIKAINAGISVISLHTRLDAGAGGVNDCLCDALGLYDVIVFGDDENPSLGRIGTTEAKNTAELAAIIKKAIGVPSVQVYGNLPTHRVAVVGGSGSDFAGAAKKYGADTIITGEVRHDEGMDFSEDEINVIGAGHYYTEFPVCTHLQKLAASIAGAYTEIFKTDPILNF